MSRKTTTALRAAMIAAVAVICLQSTMTKKAEAIADPLYKLRRSMFL